MHEDLSKEVKIPLYAQESYLCYILLCHTKCVTL